MKIFVTGDGFVGGELKRHYREYLCEDISKADVVINTVGVLKEGKYTYESSHVEYLKKLVNKVKGKKLIHFSALGARLGHPSRYMDSKARGEEIIKNGLKNYAVLKPSIILGEGQKLYRDLERFKRFPVVFVPKMKVAPVNIEDVLMFCDRVINEDLKGEFELCGSVVSMRELFGDVFKKMGKSPLILEMPKAFFYVMLPFLSFFDIMGRDEYLMIGDNICKDGNGE